MPNNFKLTGDFYVSKFGNDSWDGLTKDTPKRTIMSVITAATPTPNKTIIVGSGVYSENINTNYYQSGINLTADGVVIFEGAGGKSFNLTNSSGGSGTWTGITIRNYTITSMLCGLVFVRCSMINVTTTAAISLLSATQCSFINCSMPLGINNGTITKSILINCSILGFATNLLTNSYINSSSLLGMSSTITAANFNWNNFQGQALMNVASTVTSGVIQDSYGRYYDLSLASGGSGTLADPYGRSNTIRAPFYFAQHRIAYPTYNASSSAADPRFNNIENWDFSLASDSPMIGRASDGTNIGGTNYAVRNAATSTAFSGGSATVDAGLGFRYTNYVVSGSAVTGSLTSAPILVNNISSKVLQKVTYNGLLAFNKDSGSASGSNVNVPDVETFTSASGNAGANPDRLVYYMRFTSGSTMPTTDTQWENAGLWPSGSYNVFEWNTKPSIDLSGRGNGSASFNPADSPTYITAQWIQLQIKLRNDYLL